MTLYLYYTIYLETQADIHIHQKSTMYYYYLVLLLFSQGGENLPERLRHYMGTSRKNVMPGFAANELLQPSK